jgi:hypothetical protein
MVTLNTQIQAHHLKDGYEFGTGNVEEEEEGRRQKKMIATMDWSYC